MDNIELDKDEILAEALRVAAENAVGKHYVRVFLDVADNKILADTYNNSLTDVVDTVGYILLTEFDQELMKQSPFPQNWTETQEGKAWLKKRTNEIVKALNNLSKQQ